MPLLNPELHPVLLPLGWPSNANEREAFSRVLLAAGADVARMLDPIEGSPSAFLRHAARMPFLRRGRETPLVALAPATTEIGRVLDTRAELLAALPNLHNARWVVFLMRSIRAGFLERAGLAGALLDAEGGLHSWDLCDGPLAIVSGDTWLAGLYQRLATLLNRADDGVVPADFGAHRSLPIRRVPSTAPAPPDDAARFDSQSPYSALHNGNLSPVPRDYLPRVPTSPPAVANRTLNGLSPEAPLKSRLPKAYVTNQTSMGSADFASESPLPFAAPLSRNASDGPRPVASDRPSACLDETLRGSNPAPRDTIVEPRSPSVPPNPRLRNR